MKDVEAEGGLVKILQPQNGIEGNLEDGSTVTDPTQEREWSMARWGQGEIPSWY